VSGAGCSESPAKDTPARSIAAEISRTAPPDWNSRSGLILPIGMETPNFYIIDLDLQSPGTFSPLPQSRPSKGVMVTFKSSHPSTQRSEMLTPSGCERGR